MRLEGNVFGHYKVLQRIGSGGMGEVYLAEDMRIERRVAVKVVHNEPTLYANAPILQEATRLFQREMKTIVSLDHPNILPLLDFGEHTIDGATYLYLVMPYRPEGSLVDWLRRQGNTLLPLQEVVHLVLQAAEALQHAHHHQIVHLDVKASNFLVRDREENGSLPDLLLADFGIAHVNATTATASQSIRGTPFSMAPEQWAGHPVAASDQYALAILAYQLLTGSFPFQGNMQQMMYQHLHESPQPPSAKNAQISTAINAVLLRALAKKPEERFPSIMVFAATFQRACQWEQGRHVHEDEIPATIPASSFPPVTARVIPTSQTLSIAPVSSPVASPKGPNKLRLAMVLGLLIVGLGNILLVVHVMGSTSRTTNTVSRTQSTNTSSSHTTTLSPTPIPAKTAIASLAPRATATPFPIPTPVIFSSPTLSTPAVTGPLDPYTGRGTLVLNDPLSDNSRGYDWDLNPTQFGTCTFTDNAYQVVAPSTSTYHRCTAQNTNFRNFAYEVELTVVMGDCGGILFRANASLWHYYYFHICQDGTYALYLYTHTGFESNTFLDSSISSIHVGLGHTNLIAIVANNDTLNLYVNHQLINSQQDSTFSSGQIAVVAENEKNPTEVVFRNAKVWTF